MKGQELHLTNLFDHVGKEREQEEEEEEMVEDLRNAFLYPAFRLEKTAVLWIRIWIRKDPHHFGYLDPHPRKKKMRIRIKIYKLDPERDPDPINLQMSSQNVWNVSLF